MDLSELLQQFGGGVTAQAPEGMDVEHEFDQVANQVPQDRLAEGVAEAFRSDQTPPFASMLGGLFGNSNGQERASVLNMLLSVAGPILMQKVLRGGGGESAEDPRRAPNSEAGMGDLLGSIFGGGPAAHGQHRDGGIQDMLGSVLGGGSGPGSGLAGILGQLMGGSTPTVSEHEVAQISPQQVEALAAEAQRHDPSVIDRLSELYAANPEMVKKLGSGALSLALSKIAQGSR